jgi:hypothetical protein
MGLGAVGVDATPQVLCSGDGFEVAGVHAFTDPAQVVKVETDGDWFNQEFVGEAVCRDERLAWASGLAVAVSGGPALPEPAAARGAVGEREEVFDCPDRSGRHDAARFWSRWSAHPVTHATTVSIVGSVQSVES